ncbi:hypothetical protein, partial [Pseudomonas aeruginosa]|uniref:hypothetical protein n=1 Tax=Pseudomonas aeruginosa TaxID=287 RepID=UPI0022CDC36D
HSTRLVASMTDLIGIDQDSLSRRSLQMLTPLRRFSLKAPTKAEKHAADIVTSNGLIFGQS